MLLYLRSILFNAAFYICTLVQMILYTPFYFILPRKKAWIVPELWARVNLWLQKHIAGTDCVVEGLENIPEGAYICAPKHQSAWDTYAFLPYLDDPVLILKRELMRIPLFGWYIAKMQMIPVDRGSRVKRCIPSPRARKGNCRRPPDPHLSRRHPPFAGAPPQYKYGIVHLYEALNLPVVPIAHNAGLYWPRRKFLRYPGTIRSAHPSAHPGGAAEGRIPASPDRIHRNGLRRISRGCKPRPQSASHAANRRSKAEGTGRVILAESS